LSRKGFGNYKELTGIFIFLFDHQKHELNLLKFMHINVLEESYGIRAITL